MVVAVFLLLSRILACRSLLCFHSDGDVSDGSHADTEHRGGGGGGGADGAGSDSDDDVTMSGLKKPVLTSAEMEKAITSAGLGSLNRTRGLGTHRMTRGANRR